MEREPSNALETVLRCALKDADFRRRLLEGDREEALKAWGFDLHAVGLAVLRDIPNKDLEAMLDRLDRSELPTPSAKTRAELRASRATQGIRPDSVVSRGLGIHRPPKRRRSAPTAPRGFFGWLKSLFRRQH